MRILVLTFYFPPDLAAGSFRAASIVDALARRAPPSAHIDVIAAIPNRYKSLAADAPAREVRGNVSVYRVKLPTHDSGMMDQSRSFAVFARRTLRLVADREFDVVFATSSRLMTATLGAWIARRKRAALYLDIRDIFVDTLQDILPRGPAAALLPVLNRIERFAVRQATHLNLVSEGFAPYFRMRYGDRQMSFHTNGIDPEFLEAAFSRSDGAASDQTEVLYAGNIGEGQGLHEVLPELARQTQGYVRYRIIGDGGRRAQLQNAIDRAGCQNVTIVPPMPRQRLIEEYARAHVLFLHLNDHPAFERVLPSKLFEYAATGRPIWAGIAGYAAQFMRQHVENCAVFQPCNVEDAIRSFLLLRHEHTSRSEFRERFARKAISEHMADEVLSLVLNRHPAVET